MSPIKIEVNNFVNLSPVDICSRILDTNEWKNFEGYFFLPGIEKAEFEKRTDSLVGSRIKVTNKDGSTHIEEIIEWDENRKVAFRFQEFDSQLKKFTSHFIEEWYFTLSGSGTAISRIMIMYPKNNYGSILLKLISILMKKALKKNLEQLKQDSTK